MRVTEKMLFQSMTRNVLKAQVRAFEAQTTAQTGARVRRSSDDPVAAAKGQVYQRRLHRLEGMEDASRTAKHQLMTAESALGEADTMFTRLREIAIQGATDSVTAQERAVIADEVQSLRESLLGLANTRADGTYVFAGYRTDTPPFQTDGTYVGDSGVRDVEVSPGTRVRVNVPGAEVFGNAGGQDIFALVDTLQGALASDNPDAVHAMLGDLGAAQEQIGLARSELGEQTRRVLGADETRAASEELLVEALQQEMGAEPVSAYSDVIEAQTALQAAMAQASRILSGLSQAPVL